jgi:hypothetical protein
MGEFNEAECLRLIASGEFDAYDLLMLHCPQARRRFKAVDKAIRALLHDVQKTFPDAQYYTASGGFNLMLGSPHDSRERGQQQLVALSGHALIGDGDF